MKYVDIFNVGHKIKPWWLENELNQESALWPAAAWHFLKMKNDYVNEIGSSIFFCAIERNAFGNWKNVIGKSRATKSEWEKLLISSYSIIFLRDPLERFLNTYIEKCIDSDLDELNCLPNDI
eukprot:UN26588